MILYLAPKGKTFMLMLFGVMPLETDIFQISDCGCQMLLHLHHPILSSYRSYRVGITLILMVKKLRLKINKKLDQDFSVRVAGLGNHACWGHTCSLPLHLTSRTVCLCQTHKMPFLKHL